MKKHWVKIEILLVCVVWIGLTAFSWFSPAIEFSLSERRLLEQFPDLTLESIDKGTFMKDFESYTLDQFPWRDSFRTIKSLAAFGLFAQKDNNDIYIAQGQAGSLDYPFKPSSVTYAQQRVNYILEKYFADSDANFYFSIVPDKSYYLAESNGYPAMDYKALKEAYVKAFSFATYIDIFDTLSGEDYYTTDSHWRQECLKDTVSAIASAMGIADKIWEDYTQVKADVPFYGVYYGQAALPLKPDTITYLTNEYLQQCTVYNAETKETTGIYNLSKLESRDPYEMFLSGATPLLVVDNPNATSDRELIIFRDSYGSSITPLLVGAYSRVTIVDTRYIHPDLLEGQVDFTAADDVLFLYSTTLLNSSRVLR